ncbi:hypothetical protein AgCh_015645 [Apium graveolens]
MGKCHISLPITVPRISAAALTSDHLNSDLKPQKKHNISFPARTQYISRDVAETSISTIGRATESLEAARLVKCGAAVMKRDPKEIGASNMNAKPKTTNRRKSAIPFIVAPLKNSLDQYQVLMYPLVTESAMKNMIENNTLVFLVDVRSDKANIKDAFEMICKIRTTKVNTLTTFSGTKKAFIKLGPDYNAIDVAKKFKFI